MLRRDFTGAELAQWAIERYGGGDNMTAAASVLALNLDVKLRTVARWFHDKAAVPEDAREQILLLEAL